MSPAAKKKPRATKRRTALAAPVAAPATVLVLRTCSAGMTAYGGFRWPESGPVAARDWKPEAICGYGLHGLLWGEGDASLLSWDEGAKWLVVEVEASTVVDLGGKVKFPRGVVVFVGEGHKAAEYISQRAPAGKAIVRGTATAGYRGTATAGDGGTATAGDGGTATAGYGGTATAGYRGTATAGDGGTATAGYGGTATAGDGGTATAGDGGTATAGDRGTATAGYRGTATAGYRGTATAGDRGTISICYYDPKSDRYRVAIAAVGEDGIEPKTAYIVGADGKLTKKDAQS